MTAKNLPLELQLKILSYLGKNDLLNCRLGDRAWDKECRKLLWESNFTQYLSTSPTDPKNVNSFIEFASPYPHIILPFHLKIHQDKVQPETLDIVTKLQQIFGSNCIHKLTFPTICVSNNDVTNFIILLSKVALDLRYLNLQSINIHFNRNDEDLTMNMIKQLKFPKLVCLKVKYMSNGVSIEDLIKAIYENSLNVTKLTVCRWFPELTLGKCLKKLHLTFRDYIEDFNRNLQTNGTLLQLETLNITCKKPPTQETFVDILKHFSGTLKSLTIQSYRTEILSIMLKFPILPLLEKLTWRCSGISDPVHLLPDDLNLSKNSLPSLKQLSLACGYFLGQASSPMPLVESIEFIFDGYDILMCKIPSNDYNYLWEQHFKNLNINFPNVSKFSLKPRPDVSEMRPPIMTLLRSLPTSTFGSQLQEIKMSSGYNDVFGQVLSQGFNPPRIQIQNYNYRCLKAENQIKEGFQLLTGFSKVNIINLECLEGGIVQLTSGETWRGLEGHKLKNVKKVKLILSSNPQTPQQGTCWEPADELKLNLMAEHLPSLREVEIIGRRREPWMKHVLEIESRFPQLNIIFDRG